VGNVCKQESKVSEKQRIQYLILCICNKTHTYIFSKVVLDGDTKVVGVIININWHDEMKPGSAHLSPELMYRLQLMQILELGIE
jgi:hypothetical protein